MAPGRTESRIVGGSAAMMLVGQGDASPGRPQSDFGLHSQSSESQEVFRGMA